MLCGDLNGWDGGWGADGDLGGKEHRDTYRISLWNIADASCTAETNTTLKSNDTLIFLKKGSSTNHRLRENICKAHI